jgi:hypothetical protein
MATDAELDQEEVGEEVDSGVRGDEAKQWKRFEPAQYAEAVGKLVHFSSKTVNSNAAASGIRLARTAAVDLPYVSARTLISAGIKLPLDYLEGGATQAGKMKQINAVLGNSDFALSAAPEEREAILTAVSQAEENSYGTGLAAVDSRLRQVVVPHEGSPGGYVSLTPITAGGVCYYLLNSEGGLLKRHNLAVKEQGGNEDRQLRIIKQAQFGIGGANPQNVGSLVRSMTRPIFVKGPVGDSSIKRAFSLFYKGFALSFSPRSVFGERLQQYREFRAQIGSENNSLSPMEMRNEEQRLIETIVESVLALGADALACLTMHEHILPREHFISGDSGQYELLSRQVPGVVRGLIDARLRELDFRGTSIGRQMNWPREAAEFIGSCVVSAKHMVEGELVALIPLDKLGRNSLISMIEEALS